MRIALADLKLDRIHVVYPVASGMTSIFFASEYAFSPGGMP
jgi:hypothetical protein